MADAVGAVSTPSLLLPTSGDTSKPKEQQLDFMKLIVAQMQNLNPMDPNAGGDSMTQMVNIETLNQITQLNRALKDLQSAAQASFAGDLVGKTVSGRTEGGATISGAVTQARMTASGPVLELAGGKSLKLSDVTGVGAG